MKKNGILLMGTLMLLSSCGTYTASGAYTGSSLGSILGSAIGGISGGPRGSDVGTIVGMAGGAIIGGAIGHQADKQREEDLAQYRQDRADRVTRRHAAASDKRQYDDASTAYSYNGGGGDDVVLDDTNSGDDRLYDFNSADYTGSYSAQQPKTELPASSSVEELAEGLAYTPHIEIRNARIVDSNQDQQISRGELCKVIFEVYNTGQKPVYDIQPSVVEATGNKQIFISPGMHVERLMPGAGIRYTAMLKAGPRLGNGSVRICLSVLQGANAISKVTEFEVPTSKKKVKAAQ